MAQARARIVTAYPSVDDTAKALGVSKQRAREIILLVERISGKMNGRVHGPAKRKRVLTARRRHQPW